MRRLWTPSGTYLIIGGKFVDTTTHHTPHITHHTHPHTHTRARARARAHARAHTPPPPHKEAS